VANFDAVPHPGELIPLINHNCFPFGGLEETTRTSSNYVDEDYPVRPEIKQSLTG